MSNVEFETSEDVEVVPTFDSMGLREELLRGIYAYGKCELRPNKLRPQCRLCHHACIRPFATKKITLI